MNLMRRWQFKILILGQPLHNKFFFAILSHKFQLKEAINWYNHALSLNPENEMYKKNLNYAQKLFKS